MPKIEKKSSKVIADGKGSRRNRFLFPLSSGERDRSC
jgi:hypothetical protein